MAQKLLEKFNKIGQPKKEQDDFSPRAHNRAKSVDEYTLSQSMTKQNTETRSNIFIYLFVNS
jgi:hypothetical protein